MQASTFNPNGQQQLGKDEKEKKQAEASVFGQAAKTDGDNVRQEFDKLLAENKREFLRETYGDWMIDVFKRCTDRCLRPSLDTDQLKEVEKRCALNCVRKHDKSFKMFDSIEDKIFNKLSEDWGFDSKMTGENLAEQQVKMEGEDMAELTKHLK